MHFAAKRMPARAPSTDLSERGAVLSDGALTVPVSSPGRAHARVPTTNNDLKCIMKTPLKGICILFGGLMVLGVFSRIGDALKTTEQRAADQRAPGADADAELDKIKMGACLAAVDAVMGRLNAPSMANIPACGWSHEKFYVSISNDHQTAIVQGQVDAQNSSGACFGETGR